MTQPACPYPHRSLHLRNPRVPERHCRLDLFPPAGYEDVQALADQLYEEILLPWLGACPLASGEFTPVGTPTSLCVQLGLEAEAENRQRVVRAFDCCAQMRVRMRVEDPESWQEYRFEGLLAVLRQREVGDDEECLHVYIDPGLGGSLQRFEGLTGDRAMRQAPEPAEAAPKRARRPACRSGEKRAGSEPWLPPQLHRSKRLPGTGADQKRTIKILSGIQRKTTGRSAEITVLPHPDPL